MVLETAVCHRVYSFFAQTSFHTTSFWFGSRFLEHHKYWTVVEIHLPYPTVDQNQGGLLVSQGNWGQVQSKFQAVPWWGCPKASRHDLACGQPCPHFLSPSRASSKSCYYLAAPCWGLALFLLDFQAAAYLLVIAGASNSDSFHHLSFQFHESTLYNIFTLHTIFFLSCSVVGAGGCHTFVFCSLGLYF